jgi:hypothetical protein
MSRRPVILAGKSENITRAQARAAAVAVRSAREKSTRNKGGVKSAQRDSIPVRLFERYLGHFGPPESKRGTAARKSASRDSAKKKGLRKAS